MKNITISECVFADDIVVIANSEMMLQHNVNIWKTALQEKGMKISTYKDKKQGYI